MIFTSSMIAAFLSSTLSIILILIWTLNPKWRSLHNYISINQIVMGSLHLIAITSNDILGAETIFDFEYIFILLNGYLYLAATCWSLCASLHAYLRLVLLYTGNISYGKRKATIFSIGTLVIVKCISDFIIPFIYHLKGFNELLGSRMMTIYVLTIVNLFLFVRIIISVMPWCKGQEVRKKGKRVSALVGVAVLCDIITSVNYLEMFIGVSDITNYLFEYRLVLIAIIVLFNRTSNDYWKALIKRRKRRKLTQASTF
ncbi:unnamed protein product [Euphydryas editha]|uniref:G-protein coupled receptors family 1 profile domain-containing protein n=1 Tax=Euphydryas editha TaxID=104508 RepID=A0AAU9TC02_EUPED|nr:unnamed protein product [Euphydryas editha]